MILWCYFSSDTLNSYAGLRFYEINRGRLFQLIYGAKNIFDLDKKSYINSLKFKEQHDLKGEGIRYIFCSFDVTLTQGKTGRQLETCRKRRA